MYTHEVTKETIKRAERLLELVKRGEISASMSGLEYYDRELKILKQRKVNLTG